MSNIAVETVVSLYARHPGISIPVDIEQLALAEGCELVDWPFIPPVKEVKQGRWIGVAHDLETKEKRYLIAHALAHHLLHCGNQLSFLQWQPIPVQKQEREADECAARILIPATDLDKVINLSPWELADYFDVPEELVHHRLGHFATEDEIEHWQRLRRHIPE
jgi:hypothetical protein